MRARIRDQIRDHAVPVADGRLEADRVLDEVEQVLHPLGGDAELGGDLVDGRIPVQLLTERATGLRHLPHLIRDVNGQPDRPALLGERPRDRLLDPPRRVRRQLVPELVVELLDRADEPEIPFLDEVE